MLDQFVVRRGLFAFMYINDKTPLRGADRKLQLAFRSTVHREEVTSKFEFNLKVNVKSLTILMLIFLLVYLILRLEPLLKNHILKYNKIHKTDSNMHDCCFHIFKITIFNYFI